MKTEIYKGFELQINQITESAGRKTQTVLIYKDGEPVGGCYADIETENAIEKAKIKVDKLIKSK